MPTIPLPTGAQLRYEDLGEGETVILVHGMLGTPWLHFTRLIGWLSPRYRLLAPTMRGYGESQPKPRDFPLNFYHRDTDDLLAFMDALEIDRAHILGYSDGGEIALIAAGKQPERFRSVAVWGAVGYFGPAMRPVAQRMYPANWMTEEEKTRHGIPDANQFVLGWINAVKHMIDSGGDVSLSLAPNITCPLLLMLGKQDTLNPEEYGRNFVEKTPNGRLQMFDCAHPVHDEQWAQFQQVVGDFLKANTETGEA
jgi:valacyclovir hydrolase